MNQKFEFTFTGVDPQLLKKEKGLRKKCVYSLKGAESLIDKIAKNWGKETSLTLVCRDLENGTLYDFEDINIIPGLEFVALQELEDQILQATAEMISDPTTLIYELTSQYNSEDDVESYQVPNMAKKPLKSSRKKGLKDIFSKLGGKKNNSNKENEKILENYELECLPDLDEEFKYEEEEIEIPITEPTESEMIETEVEEVEEFDFEEEETTSSQVASEPFLIETYRESEEQSSINEIVSIENTIPGRKHESVHLITMQDYCNFGENIDSSIKSMSEKLSTESLFKFVGISTTGLSNTRIDEYRTNYAKLRLSESTFENLREQYSNKIAEFSDIAMSQLERAVDKAWKTPYDLEVNSEYEEELLEIKTLSEQKQEEFIERQRGLVSDKIKKFESEQEIEKQNFLTKLEADKVFFISSEEEKSTNIIDSKIESLNKEMENSIDKFVDEKMYELKLNANKNLSDGKRKLLQDLKNEITDINAEVWSIAIKNIKEIKNEIEEKTPLWAKEINEFNALEEQEHKRERELQEIEIEKQKVEISKEQTKVDLKRMDELDQENKALKIQLQEAVSRYNVLNEINESKKNGSSIGIPFFNR